MSNTKLDLAVDRILAWIFNELEKWFDLAVSTGMKFLSELMRAFVEDKKYLGPNKRKGGDFEGFIVPDDESVSEEDEDECGGE